MSNWYQMRERGAGKFRMEILWVVYRVFGLGVLKFVARVIAWVVAIFASAPRAASRRYRAVLNEYERKHNLKLSRFSSIGHICTFAASVVDKMSAICDKKTPLKFAVADSPDWHKLQELLATRRGAFFICSHMGNIETWGAMPGGADVHMHAFMDMEVNHQFRDFIARHARYDNTTIHPVENIGMAAAGDMYDALRRGELVMMAGDRISATAPAKVINVKILDRDCKLPMGVFRFARACDAPVFAVVAVNIGHATYKLYVRELTTDKVQTMADEYAEFLQGMILSYPKQWFNFFEFF